jgi:hypothetical protein
MIQERNSRADYIESLRSSLSTQLLGRDTYRKMVTPEDAMGREADCKCVWKESTADVRVLLETYELILRGGIRRKIPFAEMQGIHTDGGRLRFVFQGEPVSLELGDVVAEKWAKTLASPPPDLAKKLGIKPESTVRVIGTIDDKALKEAVSGAASTSAKSGDLLIARVETPTELSAALKKAATELSKGVPIWIVYRKGKGHALSEAVIRATGLAAGLVDTKLASVSPALTALRFNKRRS